MIQTSTSLKYDPSSELLLITAKCTFRERRVRIKFEGAVGRVCKRKLDPARVLPRGGVPEGRRAEVLAQRVVDRRRVWFIQGVGVIYLSIYIYLSVDLSICPSIYIYIYI